MLRPHKMRHLELTILERDLDRVLAYLGKKAIMHLTIEQGEMREADADKRAAFEFARSQLRLVEELSHWLGLSLPDGIGDGAALPSDADRSFLDALQARIERYRQEEALLRDEEGKLKEAISEARAFEKLKAPFAELDQLSYMALRIGRLDARHRDELRNTLGERAVVVGLGEGDRILAASSRKGRFALDSELKRAGFVPLSIPEGFTGVPAELLEGLEARLAALEIKKDELIRAKESMAEEYTLSLARLAESMRMASQIAEVRISLDSSASASTIRGWVPQAKQDELLAELERLTDGRIAIRTREPDERRQVAAGQEKVPVSIEHGGFIGGFTRMVFSYGAPLYGTIDPTPFVAFSFIVLFGLMFGDVGQGFVLLLLGLLVANKNRPFFGGFSRFSAPLKGVGVASMIVGLLDGEVFANEHLLIRPTRFITGALTGVEMDRIIFLMPEKGSLDKLFIFFGFTIGVGILLNSIGLIINMTNLVLRKKWVEALFSKTGLAGALFFWWAVGLAVRIIAGGSLAWFDIPGFVLPLFMLVTGPVFWRLFSGDRPVFEHGFLTFAMEGFVEILESVSSYVSNTVSFLRVGAFALSHAVLSFIVFTLSDMVAGSSAMGPFLSLLVVILGNVIIIVLEGLIVAIQVVRLQYYEFFSKFFTDTGIEFAPFRFNKEISP